RRYEREDSVEAGHGCERCSSLAIKAVAPTPVLGATCITHQTRLDRQPNRARVRCSLPAILRHLREPDIQAQRTASIRRPPAHHSKHPKAAIKRPSAFPQTTETTVPPNSSTSFCRLQPTDLPRRPARRLGHRQRK